MTAYLIAEHLITDAVKKIEEYRVKVGPMIATYGGRHITKGGKQAPKCDPSDHRKSETTVSISVRTPRRTTVETARAAL
jgi:uncharacterized protein (DUF1330 family)